MICKSLTKDVLVEFYSAFQHYGARITLVLQ